MQYGVYNISLGGFLGLNLTLALFSLLLFTGAAIQTIRGKKTRMLEIAFLTFLVALLFPTFHGKLLQYVLPITLPEKPLVDNVLTVNYALSNLLAFAVFPILALAVLKSSFCTQTLGLKVADAKKTIIYSLIGVTFNVLVFLLANSFFGYKWISAYTIDGFILWTLLVTIASVFIQTIFFTGILFNKYTDKENNFLLAVISISAFQATVTAYLPWLIAGLIASSAKVFVTWKTRNIYGAVMMGITVSFIEVALQIL